MTLPNSITIARICLIPLFAVFAWRYGVSSARGRPDEALRLTAAVVFILAASMDGLDGYIARRFNQRSRLGAILDPLADKATVWTGIVVPLLSNWPDRFPIWFPIAVIGRDLILLVGFLSLSMVFGDVDVRPSRIGKAATLLQIASIFWLLLGPRGIALIYPAALATLLTVISGFGYVGEGFRLAQIAARTRRDIRERRG
jgi:CDP-diacylglycerol--glycerol-3-phosphate 3-phosphatidyltransferase